MFVKNRHTRGAQSIHRVLFCGLLALASLFLQAQGYSYSDNKYSCQDKERNAYSTESSYNYPRGHSWDDGEGYDNNLHCELKVTAYFEEDGVSLKFSAMDMEPPTTYHDFGTCKDKVIVHDGDSRFAPELGVFCGTSVEYLPSFESSGNTLLLEFITDGSNMGNTLYTGFEVTYTRIDRGGLDTGLGAGTLVAIILPCLLIYSFIFFLIYRKCKYAQRVRQNLAATGHTPEDMRMAMLTMVEQASRGPITNTNGSSHQSGRGVDMQNVLLTHMNANRDRRLAEEGGGEDGGRGRVRHPAGDSHYHQNGRGDRAEFRDLRDDSGSDSPRTLPIFNIEDNDRDSHHSRQNSRGGPYYHAYSDAAPPPNPYHHHRGHQDQGPYHHPHSHLRDEEDRHSHGSGRSGRSGRHSQGHRTPSPRSRSGRNSPYAPPALGDPGMTVTYYGDIDPRPGAEGGNLSTDPMHEPPPSYEEAATGKFDPPGASRRT